MKRSIIFAVAAFALTGCGATNNYLAQKTKTVEYYRIFDLKTSASRQVVSKAASDGIGRNAGNAQEATPIPASGEIPEKPGRFKLVNPFEGSKLAMLAGAGGGTLGFRMATCEGASWTAQAQRNVSGSNNLNLTACLFQYKEGYHLDLYAVFTEQEGGLKQISRDMAYAMVGTPEEWTEKTFLDIVRSIRAKTGAEVTLIEAQPELAGTPWLDSGDSSHN
ncbi:MAG: lipoprotein [Desulfurivibrionaceae bacterium]